MYAVTGSFAKTSDSPSVASKTSPRHVSSSKRLFIRLVQLRRVRIASVESSRITISVDGISRRSALKAMLDQVAGVVTGAGAYGYCTGATPSSSRARSCRSLVFRPALAGFRIGLMTDVHRSHWVSAEDVHRAVRLLMSEKPDLVVLGGDYVTWGDRQVRRTVSRSARRR